MVLEASCLATVGSVATSAGPIDLGHTVEQPVHKAVTFHVSGPLLELANSNDVAPVETSSVTFCDVPLAML
jgi:hypothetical protein